MSRWAMCWRFMKWRRWRPNYDPASCAWPSFYETSDNSGMKRAAGSYWACEGSERGEGSAGWWLE